MKKNDIIELEIIDTGVNGEGMGRFGGMAFFVKGALPGDLVRAVVTKVKNGFAFAKTLQILSPSPFRVDPVCSVAGRCGGCQIMQLEYKKQLKLKEEKVKNDLERIGQVKRPLLRPIIGMDEDVPAHFRNKVQFPVGRSRDGRVITGFYAGRTHYIIETDNCPVSAAGMDRLLNAACRFIRDHEISVRDEMSGQGLIRHILLRKGQATGQLMICLVINGDSLGKDPNGGALDDLFVKEILSLGLSVTSICLNINKGNTNAVLGEKVVTLYGKPYIEDMISGLSFRISPLSFFQVNGQQTPKLYDKAMEYASLSGKETVWDLYCGTGTISLFLAKKAKMVYGVEIVQAAIDNAIENAEANRIRNARFFCGRSEKVFPGFYAAESKKGSSEQKPDVVVLDPPRKGCERPLLDAILEIMPDRIVYVSCNSATLARDIKILSPKYEMVEATPVDMFPHTVHVETVVLLTGNT